MTNENTGNSNPASQGGQSQSQNQGDTPQAPAPAPASNEAPQTRVYPQPKEYVPPFRPAVVLRNSFGNAAPPAPPVKPHNQPYRYEMIFDSGKYRAYADDAVALVSELISGYLEPAAPPLPSLHRQPGSSDTTNTPTDSNASAQGQGQGQTPARAQPEIDPVVDRLAKRIVYAVTAQVQLQAGILAEYSEEELAQLTTEEERAILMAPRDVPPTPESWDSPVPLVMVATYYWPEGELAIPESQPRPNPFDPNGPAEPQPGSNMLWIDPYSEMSLLRTLHRVGYITLAEYNPPAAPAQPTKTSPKN